MVEWRLTFRKNKSGYSLDCGFEKILVKIGRNKAPGKDRITNEDIKLLLPQESGDFEFGTFSEMALNMLFNLIEVFWKFEKMPVDLKRVILRPFLKNIAKDGHDPKNYRTIFFA